MATEKLIVELDAKTAKLDQKLNATNKRIDHLDTTTKKAETSIKDMAKVGAAAFAGLTAAVTAATVEAANFARELQVAADRANISTERLQGMAFATRDVNISMEKLGDIFKDANEKIGEFVATGGGGFQDFVDVMRLTEDQAAELAEKFQMMAAPDVLQEMVNQMQAAGVSSQQMSFALEGLASDTTDLIPLLEDGGERLNDLTREFTDLDVALSSADIEKIKAVDMELKKVGENFSGETRGLIAEYSEELIKVIAFSAWLGETTTDLLQTIATGWKNIIDLAAANLTDLVNGTDTFDEVLAERTALSAERVNELVGERLFEAGRNIGEQISDGINSGLEEGQNDGINIVARGGKRLTDWEKLNSKQRINVSKDFLSASKTLNQALLDDNKAINAGLIVADTAAGIMRAYKESNFWVATAQAAVIAATGIAQLSNLDSASKGGGNISGGSSSASASSPQSDPDFEQETTSLEVTEASVGGSSVQRIEFATDSGDELIDAIATALNNGQRTGQF